MQKSFVDPLRELEACLKDLTSTSIGRRAFLASLPLLMASCATPDKTRYREGDNTGQETHLTPEQERKMTQEVLPQMRKEYPPIQNAELQSYVSQLGRKLVAANNLEGHPYNYTFTAVDVPYVNAFALPAGTVFLTAPLIEMAESEAELMGVIGHEVGHIKARHTAERMAKAEKEQKKGWLYAVGGGVLAAGLGYGVGKLACPPKDKNCVRKATEMGALAGVAGGLLIQKYAFMANSREDEMEADRIGFRTSVTAGYDSRHVGRFYDKLYQMEQKAKKNQTPILGSLADAMSTHPPSAERVKQMREMSANAPSNSSAVVSTASFDRARKVASQYAEQARARAKKS